MSRKTAENYITALCVLFFGSMFAGVYFAGGGWWGVLGLFVILALFMGLIVAVLSLEEESE